MKPSSKGASIFIAFELINYIVFRVTHYLNYQVFTTFTLKDFCYLHPSIMNPPVKIYQ